MTPEEWIKLGGTLTIEELKDAPIEWLVVYKHKGEVKAGILSTDELLEII